MSPALLPYNALWNITDLNFIKKYFRIHKSVLLYHSCTKKKRAFRSNVHNFNATQTCCSRANIHFKDSRNKNSAWNLWKWLNFCEQHVFRKSLQFRRAYPERNLVNGSWILGIYYKENARHFVRSKRILLFSFTLHLHGFVRLTTLAHTKFLFILCFSCRW